MNPSIATSMTFSFLCVILSSNTTADQSVDLKPESKTWIKWYDESFLPQKPGKIRAVCIGLHAALGAAVAVAAVAAAVAVSVPVITALTAGPAAIPAAMAVTAKVGAILLPYAAKVAVIYGITNGLLYYMNLDLTNKPPNKNNQTENNKSNLEKENEHLKGENKRLAGELDSIKYDQINNSSEMTISFIKIKDQQMSGFQDFSFAVEVPMKPNMRKEWLGDSQKDLHSNIKKFVSNLKGSDKKQIKIKSKQDGIDTLHQSSLSDIKKEIQSEVSKNKELNVEVILVD